MAFNKHRNPPQAFVGAETHANCGDRVIILSNSRGDMRISPAEARELARQLIEAVDQTDQLHSQRTAT